MISSSIGYPYIGENREWKRALEAFWGGKIEEQEFLETVEKIRLERLQKQKDAGISLIPVGEFTLYDRMLDTAVMFGMIPERYNWSGGDVQLSTYFSMARGNDDAVASEMTKLFNANYHYIVPEYGTRKLKLTENKPLTAYLEAKEKVGIDGKPVLIGPYSFLKLSKGYEEKDVPAFLLQLIPLYVNVLCELYEAGAKWVQLEEPILSTSISKEEMLTVTEIYKQLTAEVPDLNMIVQTYFDAVEHYEEVVALPVAGIGLDFVAGKEKNLTQLKKNGFPEDKVLAAGVIDGRNIWRADLHEKTELVDEILEIVSADRVWIQPSSSLLHVPVTLTSEVKLDSTIKGALAFADEKLEEVTTLVKGVVEGKQAIGEKMAESTAAREKLAALPARNHPELRQAVENIGESDGKRKSTAPQRRLKQQEALGLPLLPTTTIGSFPQTPEVRSTRNKWRKGESSDAQYTDFVHREIAKWIDIQEDIGLDVFVHGEFERTDMVEYFGEKLGGFVFTEKAWVVSYGSRCVKPPIIYGDVTFLNPITVEASVYAASLTDKPMKGMLTGPVTILNWSFVRDDISRKDVTYQIALALREEIEALEAAGIPIIQVDEPALREGLPLKKSAWNDYLDWAITAFRVATGSVEDTTQIHTHMCYCEFNDFIDSISGLDADVISIETSRSHGDLVSAFNDFSYDKGIGLGVYDIHSPRVPEVQEMVDVIEQGLNVLEPSQFWINPDCGLKTRKQEETVAALKNMAAATNKMRERLEVLQK
ncbi:5-methyltetrahydropteroyltriglutamate--homocysteine S-methyltransferase [Sporosarcina sp. BI001-red]|uniref:5-methyltetrahydropteroyltriglutamate-- homocysteine S-methyltransferase n=1 Tax=Sporosarcina sp. BI001-red TaxID=2282866 RepID=UPI000E267BB4|nr:5-methyltetrahydropteroyltriglutamate--homocysteine S-methyltransferase [Sporosarcina sp. BI001-red]REB05337.1 5-methyltetrahydropteroyltriglutamate--homocysteine S-methyltransferase [Sporosarcina sp. BI001-red]